MSADTQWNVKVLKLYTETIKVQAATREEAYENAQQERGVVMVESVEWIDPHDPYPRICELCDATHDGDDEAAKADGWKLGWDGWVCPKHDL